MRHLIRTTVFVSTFALLAGCTCNRADQSRRQQIINQKREFIESNKLKGKPFRRSKAKLRRLGDEAVEVPKVDVELHYLDAKKLEAGEDPWVAVERKAAARNPLKNAVWHLFKGPNEEEKAKGLTFVKSGAEGFEDFKLVDKTVEIKLRGGCDAKGSTTTVYDHLARTLKAFPEVDHVKVYGPDGQTNEPDGTGDSRPACLEP